MTALSAHGTATCTGARHLADRRSARDRSDHPEAQRGSRAGTTTVPARPGGTARDGSPANDDSPFARGLETDPVTRALVGEEIGRHDSAAAWTLENPLDWASFVAVSPTKEPRRSTAAADILIAAQFGRPEGDVGQRRMPSLAAPFVSNCYDADWISSTVLVDVDDPRGRARDAHDLLQEECEIVDTWDVMGMGTGEATTSP